MKSVVLALATLLLIPSLPRPADDPLSAAKELYAAAAYEDALAALAHLSEDGNAPADLVAQIDEYRSFCLYALGRTQEAESVAQGLVRKNPLFKPQSEDISPRVEAMFTHVRKQLLPTLIRDRYRAAKAAIDRKDFAEAEPQLVLVKEMIGQAEKLGIRDESVNDLAVLADGFLDLARASAPKPAVTAAAAPPATATNGNGGGAPAAKTDLPAAPRLFDATSAGIVQPVAIRQTLPSPPAALARVLVGKRGVLAVTIDPDGRVVDAVMREPVNAAYDTMVVNAAKMWRFKPATKDGVAVRFVKEVGVQIQNE
jgi:TonB family protein